MNNVIPPPALARFHLYVLRMSTYVQDDAGRVSCEHRDAMWLHQVEIPTKTKQWNFLWNFHRKFLRDKSVELSVEIKQKVSLFCVGPF